MAIACDDVFEILLGVDEVQDYQERFDYDAAQLGVSLLFWFVLGLQPSLCLMRFQQLLEELNQRLKLIAAKFVQFQLLLDQNFF